MNSHEGIQDLDDDSNSPRKKVSTATAAEEIDDEEDPVGVLTDRSDRPRVTEEEHQFNADQIQHLDDTHTDDVFEHDQSEPPGYEEVQYADDNVVPIGKEPSSESRTTLWGDADQRDDQPEDPLSAPAPGLGDLDHEDSLTPRPERHESGAIALDSDHEPALEHKPLEGHTVDNFPSRENTNNSMELPEKDDANNQSQFGMSDASSIGPTGYNPPPAQLNRMHGQQHSLDGQDHGYEPTPKGGEHDSRESEDDLHQHSGLVQGSYDAGDFAGLSVNTEVKELFQFIEAYQPQMVEIQPVLKPFVLDYIPSVGDIDAFIKIPRPDEVDDQLGLVVLDEPCAKQSDPTILNLKLQTITKDDTAPKQTVVKKLERADKNTKEIDQWMASIRDLHKSKPPANVHYSKPMPDIETLMQEWPPQVEEMLKKVELPTADMDVTLESYIDMVCAILDIPIHKSRVQALHLLFTLFSEFKNSQHFANLAEQNQLNNDAAPMGDLPPSNQNMDRLEL